jgi:hypothetical protein
MIAGLLGVNWVSAVPRPVIIPDKYCEVLSGVHPPRVGYCKTRFTRCSPPSWGYQSSADPFPAENGLAMPTSLISRLWTEHTVPPQVSGSQRATQEASKDPVLPLVVPSCRTLRNPSLLLYQLCTDSGSIIFSPSWPDVSSAKGTQQTE